MFVCTLVARRLAGFVFGCLFVYLAWGAAAVGATPNVVLIISDDQAWTDYGFLGHPHIATPELDRLAHESLTFTRGYVPSSLCRPSLATMISGLYPEQHKIVGNDPAPPAGETAAASRGKPAYLELRQRLIDHIDAIPTLPKLLGTRGYLSHQSGKWWEGNYARGGFTHGMTRGFPEPGGRHGDDGLTIGREGLEPIFDFIRESRKRQQPFLVWYAPFLPHTPHTPPAELLEKYGSLAPTEHIAKYWAMCEWFDKTCGQLLSFLDDNDLRENTLVVYVTDNGWINRADRSAYAPRSKRSPNEGGIRTPIMIRYPAGNVPAMMDDQTLASSIDLAPTILRACGMEPTPDMTGIDLLSEEARAARKQLRGKIYEHDVVDVDRPAASLRYSWAIEMPWKVIVPNPLRVTGESIQLYHLIDDPHERENVADQHPDIVRRLSQVASNSAAP